MSLVAEIPESKIVLAGRVAARTELKKIALVEGTARLAKPFSERELQIPGQGLLAEISRKLDSLVIHHNSLKAIVRFKLIARMKGGKKRRPLLEVSAAFGAEYVLLEGFKPAKEELNSFLEANVVFNCWPYWREFVQSNVARMNVPPLTLPFFRVVPERKKEIATLSLRKAKT